MSIGPFTLVTRFGRPIAYEEMAKLAFPEAPEKIAALFKNHIDDIEQKFLQASREGKLEKCVKITGPLDPFTDWMVRARFGARPVGPRSEIVRSYGWDKDNPLNPLGSSAVYTHLKWVQENNRARTENARPDGFIETPDGPIPVFRAAAAVRTAALAKRESVFLSEIRPGSYAAEGLLRALHSNHVVLPPPYPEKELRNLLTASEKLELHGLQQEVLRLLYPEGHSWKHFLKKDYPYSVISSIEKFVEQLKGEIREQVREIDSKAFHVFEKVIHPSLTEEQLKVLLPYIADAIKGVSLDSLDTSKAPTVTAWFKLDLGMMRRMDTSMSEGLYDMMQRGFLRDGVVEVGKDQVRFHKFAMESKCLLSAYEFPPSVDVSRKAVDEFMKWIYDFNKKVPEEWPDGLVKEVNQLANLFKTPFLFEITKEELAFRKFMQSLNES